MSTLVSELQYPVGKFELPAQVNDTIRREWIANISATPNHLRKAVHGLNPAQLDTPYREGGWTVRQVVHHVPDSHLHELQVRPPSRLT